MENTDVILTNRQSKEAFLKHFMDDNSVLTTDEGYFQRSRFLYLYGGAGTGKESCTEKVAHQVFGDSWKDKVYIRIAKNQKFPYKLHSEKVESSKKIIFICRNTEHLAKWRSMYPYTKTICFEGCEFGTDVEPVAETETYFDEVMNMALPIVKVKVGEYNRKRISSHTQLKVTMINAYDALEKEGKIDSETCQYLKNIFKDAFMGISVSALL